MFNQENNSKRPVTLRGSLFIGLVIIGVFAAGALSAMAQTPSPSPTPATEVMWGSYKVTSASEIGWRFRGLSGNENKYRSDLNYSPGFRTFDTNLLLEADNGKGKYFDSLLISNSGWGSDPTGSTRFNMEKTGFYKFNADVKRVTYFNNLFNFVNPVPFANSEHSSNIKHTFGDFDITILPQNETLRFTAGGSFNNTNGAGGTTDRFFSDEFPILTDTRSRSHDLRFGAEGKLFGFDWGLSQGFRTFKDRSTGFLDAVNQGNNPTNQSRLDTYFRSSPIDGDVYFTQFHAHRTFAEKFDFTARMIYSSASSHSSRVQTMTGRDNTNPTGILVTSDNINVIANAKRPQTRGDLGITYAATDKFRISNTFSFDQFSVNGDEMFQEIWTKASGSTLRSTTLSSAYRVNSYRRFVNTIEADYQFSNAVALHVGYRYTKRDINNNGFDTSCTFTTGLCTPTTTPFVESETNSTNALIAGMKIRPVKNWTIYWDVEHGLADNVFTRLENYKYTNFRVRSRVTLNKVSFNFSASSKDNENASLPRATITLPSTVNYITNTQNRYFSGTVDWDPMANLSFSTGYNYRHLTSYTPVAVPISGAPGGYAFGFSQFFMRDHFFYFDVTARPTNRVSLYASYRINRDKGQGDLVSSPITIAAANFITSYPMQFASPEGRVVFRISRNVDWNIGYQYYDYKDDQTPFMNYRAHLPYTSLRIYFGGRAADR
ncbi:MAG TPA: hypothetical protein PLL77_12280 [Pyrinomonadaceae bacterium]|nr:hypothetical protein [Pyrinomonadaceae bacterium]